MGDAYPPQEQPVNDSSKNPDATTKKWRIATFDKDFEGDNPKGDIEFYPKNTSGDGPEGDKVENVNTITTENVGDYVVEDKTTIVDNGSLEERIARALNKQGLDMKALAKEVDKAASGLGGRRRSRRKGSKKSKKGAKKSKKGGRSRKNRRKYSRRRKH